MSRHSSITTRRSFRRLALATLVATTGIAATSAVAGAAAAGHSRDDIVFSSHARVTPLPDGTSRVVMVVDSCTLSADGAAPIPCAMSAIATLQPDGSGTARAVITVPGRAIVLDEVFWATGPGTGSGSGSATETGPGGPTSGTFTTDYMLAPTDDPAVLLDWGTITVTH